MDINDNKKRELVCPDPDKERRMQYIEWLEIAEAIQHLDSIVSDLEHALHLNGK